MATTPRTASTADRDEHVHGTMDVRAHERTFHGFLRAALWSAVASLAVLAFLALANA